MHNKQLLVDKATSGIFLETPRHTIILWISLFQNSKSSKKFKVIPDEQRGGVDLKL